MKMVTINCEQCKQDVDVPYKHRFNTFCSLACYKRFYSETVNNKNLPNPYPILDLDDMEHEYYDIIYGGHIPAMMVDTPSFEHLNEIWPTEYVELDWNEGGMDLELEYDDV